jgi:hypothetical protein
MSVCLSNLISPPVKRKMRERRNARMRYMGEFAELGIGEIKATTFPSKKSFHIDANKYFVLGKL